MNLLLKSNVWRRLSNLVTTSALIRAWNTKFTTPRGGTMGLYCKEIVHTLTAAATNTISTTAIPDGALLMAVTGRVLTAVALQSDRVRLDMVIGGTTYAALTCTSQAAAAGSTFSSTSTSATAPLQVSSDTDITITAAGGTSGNIVAGGVIRFEIWYWLATAPTL